MQFLERVKERGDSIIADTQYFWKDTSRYSNEALAKVFVGMPDAGTTPEENVILEIKQEKQQFKESIKGIYMTEKGKVKMNKPKKYQNERDTRND
jgi:hypothetical protein